MAIKMEDLENVPMLRRRKNREDFLKIFDDKTLLTSSEIAKKLGYSDRSSVHFGKFFSPEELEEYRIELMGPEDGKPRYYYGKKEVVAKFRVKAQKIVEARKKEE